jgi:hypothetical protein
MFLDMEIIEALGRLSAARRQAGGGRCGGQQEQGQQQQPDKEQQQQQQQQQNEEEEEEEVRRCLSRVRRLLAASCKRAAAVEWTTQGLQDHGQEGDEEPGGEHSDGSAAVEADGTTLNTSRRSSSSSSSSSSSDSGSSSSSSDGDFTPTPEAAAALDALITTLLAASCVAGLHPDAATEPAVRLALALNKPFAVVPCCVYSAQFPGRRLASGEAVTKHAQLVEYLSEITAAAGRVAERVALPFEGMSLCVWSAAAAEDGEAGG